MSQLLPGDIVVVRTPGLPAWVIRFGEMLQGRPDLRNHVAMLHHCAAGANWYLEGRPGGVGWRVFRADADSYASSPWTVSNSAQPRTDAQRAAICARMQALVGTPYDWAAIEGDAAIALHLPEVWPKWGDGTQLPGHVVCSSSAALAYKEEGVAAPEVGGGRFTEPADWDAFIMAAPWEPRPSLIPGL
jgi:hypothetical protein